MENNASGAQLAEYTAADAAVNSVFVASDHVSAEITRFVVANTTGAGVVASLHINNTGTFALLYPFTVPANGFVDIQTHGPNGGIHLKKGGAIGFQDASSGDLILHVFGITQPVHGLRESSWK